MAVLKVACPKCGQKVSGDESFFGTTVECPICTSTIHFPEAPGTGAQTAGSAPAPASVPAPKTAPEHSAGPATPAPPEAPSPEPRRETSPIPLPPRGASAPSAPVNEDDIPSPVLGVVAMVLGLVSVMLFCLPGIICGPAAIICGHMARSKARHSPIQPAPGNGAALTGLILGYLSLAGFILVIMILPGAMEWIRSTKAPE